jgi:hypothetical protein
MEGTGWGGLSRIAFAPRGAILATQFRKLKENRMFLVLELWPEKNETRVGRARAALLDFAHSPASTMPTTMPVNSAAIVVYERIKVVTEGRWNSSDHNKQDHLAGVRIRLSDGSQWIVLDGRDHTFESKYDEAFASGEAIFDCGRSTYAERFAVHPA